MPIPSHRQPLRVYIAAGGALLFLSILILSAHSPSIEFSDTLAQLGGGGRSSEKICDPHSLPGRLILPENFDNYSNAINTRWQPLDEALCPSPVSFAKRIRERESIPGKLHGRTILAIGDSIERNNVAYSCHLLNGTHTTVQPGHAYWPQKDIPGAWTPNEYSHRSFPSMCYIESVDLLLVNVFHFGLDEEEYFGWKDQYGPPYNIQDRVEQIAMPLMQKIDRDPDIVEFSSGLWDAARWGRQDDGQLTAESIGVLRHLSLDRLRWYSHRYSSLLSVVAAHFPSSQLFSRKLHISADDSAGEFQQWWQVAGGGKDGKKHTFYFPSWRMNEINAAMQDAIDRVNKERPRRANKWQMDTWADKIYGAEVYEKGNVHPHHAVTTLWLDQMLYRLYLA